jgi:hypothetical protein
MTELDSIDDMFNAGFEPDSTSTRLWRYVSLEKLLRCLQQEGFWFSTYDRLGDPWEGTPLWESIEQSFAPLISNLIDVIERPRPGVPPDQQWIDAVQELKEAIPQNAKPLWDARISCWHCRPSESHAMWKIYAGQGKGFAVCTTLEQLVRGLHIPEGFQLKIGRVRYTDFDQPNSPDLGRWDALFRKWHYFDYESEVRLVLVPIEESQDRPDLTLNRGMIVKAELPTTISEVVIAPGSGGSEKEMVENLLHIYGLGHIPVRISAMAESPEQFVDRRSRWSL